MSGSAGGPLRRVVIRGTGDVASAVAQRLFLTGDVVVLQDGPQPATTRRGMAFADAVFDGRAELAGVAARAPRLRRSWRTAPVGEM